MSSSNKLDDLFNYYDLSNQTESYDDVCKIIEQVIKQVILYCLR